VVTELVPSSSSLINVLKVIICFSFAN